MNYGIRLKKENPKTTANFFSKLTYTWMLPLYKKGVKRGLEVSDLYKTLECDCSEALGNKLEENWDRELIRAKEKQKQPSLIRAISNTFFWNYMFYGLLLFAQFVCLRSSQPVILSYLLRLFANDEDEDKALKMYLSGSILVGLSLLIVFITYHVNFGQASIGMRIRVAVSSLIYRKILRLHTKSLGHEASGKVVNLLSNDINRFDMIVVVLNYLWIMPFQFAIIVFFIWQEVGIASMAGALAMILLTLPVHAYLGKKTSILRLQVAKKTDNRVRLTNEIISGIKVIKMYAWEKPFEKLIQMAREQEIKVLTSASYLRGIYLSFIVFPAKAALFSTVVCFVLLGNTISADKVFSMAQYFSLLQLSMAIFCPLAINVGAETLISIKRLQEFLLLEEKQAAAIPTTVEDKRIVLKGINASWTDSTPTLENININIPPGSLCAIVGPVGSGKSSLLHLLLGELTPQSGSLQIGGTISYASQESWLFGGTVRNNILFGKPYDHDLYQQVVNVCALRKDFHQFPEKDNTIVGERGVSLSGGQRARINLARAIYKQADIYIVDDPLSAVDPHVGKYLFEECIDKYLKGKTRILVTHQLQHLEKVDHIIVLNEGKIEIQGTYADLLKSNLDFTKYINAPEEPEKDEEKEEEEIKAEIRRSLTSDLTLKAKIKQELTMETIDTTQNFALIAYLRAGGSCLRFSTLIAMLLIGQMSFCGADYWITYWTQQVEEGSTFRILNDTDLFTFETEIIDTNIAIYIYTALIVTSAVIAILSCFLFFKVSMNASHTLHTKMFRTLLESPMKFFELNPVGRILNRFSKDMGTVDEVLPRVMLDTIQSMLVLLGILVMVGISNKYNILVILVLGALFMQIRKWYISTAKDIKHLEGITKSPVFSHLNSSINGVTTIRASNVDTVLKKQFDTHQDVHTSAWFLTIACAVSFGLWLDLMCVIFFGCVTFSCIILDQYDEITGSLAGLAISQSLSLMGMLQHGMRQTAEVVNQLTSVERVLEYTELETEGPFDTPKEKLPPKSWPDKGRIQFQNLSLRYPDYDKPVLKNLNFTVEPQQKIGIVGRTGAGKSSLTAALFRFATLEGTVIIDDVNINELGLKDLRKSISIIPQEPILFSASLRHNLDPFDEFDDMTLWHALEEVELKNLVPSLDFMVSEGGSNFSLGQRQLVCLARAIIRNNKILILDEATANVDLKTDSLIQDTIRDKFKHCTVLTIAHRLNTIMDSDKVLVMDKGKMVEFDHPFILLQNDQGFFHSMVAEMGPATMQQLYEIAERNYHNNNNNEE